jgi:Icc-related predicted phosphoesterase
VRILHLADLHGRLLWFEWAVKAAPNFDLVALSGDLLDREEDAPAVAAVLQQVATPLAVCSGNHEGEIGTAWIAPRPKLWRDGESFPLGGWRFRCIPWGEPLPAAAGREIWIVHAPPRGTRPSCTRFGIDHGDLEFAQLCRRGQGPALALCGHVHEPAQWSGSSGPTQVVNPGCMPDSPVPVHNLVDLARLQVEHVGPARKRRPQRCPP